MIKINDIYNQNLKSSNILVLGDIIYDKYVFGNADRLSPEAPVPIFKTDRYEFRLGGAANVFNNIVSLGARARLCGIIGNDKEGMDIRSKIIDLSGNSDLIIVSNERQTTKKTRLLVGNHHMLRIDEEITSEIEKEAEKKIFDMIAKTVDIYDLVVISDYNKGLLTCSFVRNIIDLFAGKGKKIITDPKNDFYKYSGSYLLKPNVGELSRFIGGRNIEENFDEVVRCGKAILDYGNFEHLYVTMGERGGVLFGKNFEVENASVFGGMAVDITGAGDTTLAALAIAVAAKIDIIKAVKFASFVAGISVSQFGTTAVSKNKVISHIQNISV